ncbi:hypothetical protein ACHAW5_002325 [Stephanodiscus triporus]|uniref:Nudix hydrolase domain-containing protein n=1 Tax=Stephanodiscus triporus TaxID=2934178 RepID=A0ABD3N506_9STRA
MVDGECPACRLELRCRWSRLSPLPDEKEYDDDLSSWSIDVREIVVEGGCDVPGGLSLVLARIAAQSAASEIARLLLLPPDGEGREPDRRRDDALLYVSLPLSDGEGCQKLLLSDLDDDNDVGVRRLFASMDDDYDRAGRRHSEAELVDMVDGTGAVLGSLPRPYVHAWNVLHRGVGLLVSKDEDVLRSLDDGRTMPLVYVHRRTSTKRIFPSLYDMFVGGVSCRGERSRTTAAREVAEELGLGRALEFVDGGGMTMTGSATTTTIQENDDPLSDELFKCTVCTPYNRCVVSVFSYVARDGEEVISWQDEEVAWGGYVPYDVVEYAAYASIERLANRGDWPGILPLPPPPPPTITTTTTTPGEVLTWESDNDDKSQCDSWDFVPDGLLVWDAWKSYVRNQRRGAVV